MPETKATPQEYWDMLILDGWKQNDSMWRIIGDFRNYVQMVDHTEYDWEFIFEDIQRGPRYFKHLGSGCPVRAFVDQVLPKINTMLWADCTYEQVMSHLVVTKGRQPPKHGPVSSADHSEKYRNKGLRFYDMHGGHRRSDWHKVK